MTWQTDPPPLPTASDRHAQGLLFYSKDRPLSREKLNKKRRAGEPARLNGNCNWGKSYGTFGVVLVPVH